MVCPLRAFSSITRSSQVHILVERIPIDEMPASEEALGQWLQQTFARKEERLRG